MSIPFLFYKSKLPPFHGIGACQQAGAVHGFSSIGVGVILVNRTLNFGQFNWIEDEFHLFHLLAKLLGQKYGVSN